MAFHPRPQIASDLGRNFARTSNPHLKSTAIPERERNFCPLWPQIQIAAGLNLLRFETRKPNPPLEKRYKTRLFFASMKIQGCLWPQLTRSQNADESHTNPDFVNDVFTALSSGGENGVLAKRGLCPLPETGGSDANGENDEWTLYLRKQGLCSSDP